MYICYTIVTTILKYITILRYSNSQNMIKTTKAPATKHENGECTQFILPIRDTLDVLSGKWKLTILASLKFGKKRFKEMERDIPKITARMLSKELRELEMNHLIKRTVYDTTPVTVEYEMTPYGKTLDNVLTAMKEWGMEHRKIIIKKVK
jgi:DNA-binding HxlR family transcriptional regulator